MENVQSAGIGGVPLRRKSVNVVKVSNGYMVNNHFSGGILNEETKVFLTVDEVLEEVKSFFEKED